MEATLKLFQALPIKEKKKKIDKNLLKRTIPLGFIFSPEIIANYSNYNELIEMTEKIVGISGEKANSSFHKSWEKIKEADLEQLVIEQIAHYLTTYGKEDPTGYLTEKGYQWNIENLSEKVSNLSDIEIDKIQEKRYVYIPKEALKIPKIQIDEIKLVVIKGYTKEELKEELLKLLNSGIAFSEDTIKDILDVAAFIEIAEKDIGEVKNKEIKAILYDYLNLFPQNPVEFLRFLVYKSTNKTLLIKNKELINETKSKDNLNVLKLLEDYDRKYGVDKLAEIFYRFKPIFLAFRTNKKLKTIINRIRKLAIKYHKPLPEDYLNVITSKLKNEEKIDIKKLKSELERVNIFRKIRLAYALKFRTKDVNSILYRIRNGKAYATDFKFEEKKEAQKVLNIVLNSIVNDVKKNVKGKKIFIPDYINYALPATEKQFTGNFPSGTYISVPKDMIFGIHWENVGINRIDLDLSLIKPTGEKIGWNALYRSEKKDILFSGDMTDAPKPQGATELFYVARQSTIASILFVNYYNFQENIEVPFKILVAKETARNFGKNYMVNPNNILAVANSKIKQKQKILGLMVSSPDEIKFYFAETSIGNEITSSSSLEYVQQSREYLLNFYQNSINLKDILVQSEAKLVKKKEIAEIDLSPEKLNKNSILDLLK